MDPEALRRVLADLETWTLVETGADGPRTTLRWKGAMMRAAGALRDAEASGMAVPGHPLANAVRRAFEDLALRPSDAIDPYVRVLLALETAELPPAVRDAL